MPIELLRCIPILRIFDEAKAREFYLDYLGFTVEWEHRFEPGMPLYMCVRKSGIELHLSEHAGDATPGASVYIPSTGIREWHQELSAKQYKYLRPGVESPPWGGLEMTLIDPFGNRLRIAEQKPA